MSDRATTHSYGDDCPGGHRNPLAQPETRPLVISRVDALRTLRQPAAGPGFEYATDGGCPHVSPTGHRCDEDLGHWPVEVTLRDLIRAARANGLRLERRSGYDEYGNEANGGEWLWERGNQYDLHVRTAAPSVLVAAVPSGWWITITFKSITIELGRDQATVPNIAAALQLCGWDIRGRS